MRVFSRNLGALDLLPGGAQLRRYPRLDLESRGYESGNEDQDGAYRQAEGPQSRRHIGSRNTGSIWPLHNAWRKAAGETGYFRFVLGVAAVCAWGFRVRKLSKLSPLITPFPPADSSAGQKKCATPPRANNSSTDQKRVLFKLICSDKSNHMGVLKHGRAHNLEGWESMPLKGFALGCGDRGLCGWRGGAVPIVTRREVTVARFITILLRTYHFLTDVFLRVSRLLSQHRPAATADSPSLVREVSYLILDVLICFQTNLWVTHGAAL